MKNYQEPKNKTEERLAFMTDAEFTAFIEWCDKLPAAETLEECLAAWYLLKKQKVNLN